MLELLRDKSDLLFLELNLKGLFGLQGLGAGLHCNDLLAEELIVEAQGVASHTQFLQGCIDLGVDPSQLEALLKQVGVLEV